MESKYPYTFKEPRRALVKAMQRRAKTSHLGAFQVLPEHVMLSCLARLPREDHDAVARGGYVPIGYLSDPHAPL